MTPFGQKIVAAFILFVLAPFIFLAIKSVKRSIEGQPIVAFFIVVFIAPPAAAATILLSVALVAYILS